MSLCSFALTEARFFMHTVLATSSLCRTLSSTTPTHSASTFLRLKSPPSSPGPMSGSTMAPTPRLLPAASSLPTASKDRQTSGSYIDHLVCVCATLYASLCSTLYVANDGKREVCVYKRENDNSLSLLQVITRNALFNSIHSCNNYVRYVYTNTQNRLEDMSLLLRTVTEGSDLRLS